MRSSAVVRAGPPASLAEALDERERALAPVRDERERRVAGEVPDLGQERARLPAVAELRARPGECHAGLQPEPG